MTLPGRPEDAGQQIFFSVARVSPFFRSYNLRRRMILKTSQRPRTPETR